MIWTLENPVIWSITISPPYRLFRPKYLYNEDIPTIRRWFRTFSKHYILFTEFDSESRIHYHGTIYINDLIKFHKTRYSFSCRVGFVKVKQLRTQLDLLKWTFYIRKDYHIMYKDFPFVMHNKIIKRTKRPKSVTKSILEYF